MDVKFYFRKIKYGRPHERFYSTQELLTKSLVNVSNSLQKYDMARMGSLNTLI